MPLGLGLKSAPPHYQPLPNDDALVFPSGKDATAPDPRLPLSRPTYRPESSPSTRIYFELFTNRPSGPLQSARPEEGIPHRSHVVWEDLAPPRTWGSFLSRIAAQEDMHVSRLVAYQEGGRETLRTWVAIDRDLGTIEEQTRENPILVKCFADEGEEREDLSKPWQRKGFWAWLTRCCAPDLDY